MVKVWVADVSPLCESGCYEAYYSALPDFRKKKADALRSVEMRAQSAGVWSLWEKIRKEYGIADDAPRNFSHSGQYVMCAVETAGKNAAVGCDLEKKGELKLRLAKRFFCPEEYEMILDQDSEEKRTDMFYRYWVLKESFMKATGKGMALPVNSFCIRLGEPPVLVRQSAEFTEDYYYMEYEWMGIPYKMAVCSTDARIDTALHTELKL